MVALVGAAIPAQAAAQGCPWCTSPTKCELIDQSAAGGCRVDPLDGCTHQGVCVINVARAAFPTPALAILDQVPAAAREAAVLVRDDLVVAWNCAGEATYAATVRDGVLHPLDDVAGTARLRFRSVSPAAGARPAG